MDKKELLEISFKPGDTVFYGGKSYQIKAPLTLERVLLIDEATQNTLTAKLSELSLDNPPSSLNKNETISFEHFDITQIFEETWKLAKDREAIIRPLAIAACTRVQAQVAAKKLKLSERQVYKLIKRYRNSNYQLKALIPGKRTGGKGKGRLLQELETIIRSAIDDVYLTKQQIKISTVIEEIHRRCYYANLKPPCDHVIRKRIYVLSDKEVITKRRNAKEAQCFTPILSSTPTPAYPLAMVQIDHTLVDVMLVDEYLRKPIGRPYLTIAIDVYSRAITGFCLTLEPPSSISVGLCLTHAVFEKEEWLATRQIETSWPIWGKPDCIYVDNASEFHSEALQRGCEAHGIRIEYRPMGRPHFGGIVERVIGTLMQFVQRLPGTTFSNIQQRGKYPSEQQAVLTLRELEKWLTIAITDYYHQKCHSNLNLPPLEKYRIGILGDKHCQGRGYPPKIINKRNFLIDFLPLQKRSLQRTGFTLDHINYYSNTLAPLIADRKKLGKFMIRRDPRDLSCIYVLDPTSQHYLEIPYRTISRPSITLWEQRQAVRNLLESGMAKVDETIIFRAIDKMRTITQEALLASKKARRNIERKKQFDVFVNQNNVAIKDNKLQARETSSRPNGGDAQPFEDIEIW